MNFVRQTQQGTGVVYSVNVSPTGNAASQGLLETGGALFQLWTIEQATAKEYLLDQKVVGAYMPSATVTIKTQDPYSLRPRTRADMPFTVSINVAGLLTTGINIPDAAKRVLLEQHVKSYTDTNTSYTLTQATSGTPKASSSIYANGTTTLNFTSSSLPGADPTKVSGEEWFVVHALADGAIAQSQIASANVQVFPVASGSIAGIGNGATVRAKPPQLTVTMKDLYPRSFTYLQVYPGEPVLGTTGTRIITSQKVMDQASSASLVLTIPDYEEVFTQDGTYTMELVTETPFGIDRLAYVSFTVSQEIEVRAMLGGVE